MTTSPNQIRRVTRVVLNPRLNTATIYQSAPEEAITYQVQEQTTTTISSTPHSPSMNKAEKKFVFVDEADMLKEEREHENNNNKRLKKSVDFFKKKDTAFESLTNYFKFQ
jgi:hypothetical protein